MSRRTLFAILVPGLLLLGWFLVPIFVRRHVDGVIQASVDKALPAFALTDTAGRKWSSAELQGKRVLLHFFRSRCHSCDAEVLEVRALEQALPADVVLLHVLTDKVLDYPPELTAQTLQAKSWRQPVLVADAAFMGAFHQVRWSQVTPITYVIDAKGIVRFGLRGAQTKASIEAALARV